MHRRPLGRRSKERRCFASAMATSGVVVAHGQIQTKYYRRRNVLLYGDAGGPPLARARRTDRVVASRIHVRPRGATVHDRCHRDPPRSSARDPYLARGRCGFLRTVAADQRPFQQVVAGCKFTAETLCEWRTRAMATTFLGAYDRRRTRFRAPRGLHPLQSCQAWIGEACLRLGIFIVPSIRA